jgi:LCP family protein required for cell wall assembly
MKKSIKAKTPDDHKPGEIIVDIVKPARFSGCEPNNVKLPFLKKTHRGSGAIIGFLFLLIFVIGISLVTWWYLAGFERGSGVPATHMIQVLREGSRYDPFSNEGILTMVVLGLDQVENRGKSTLMTDTIILLTIHKDGRVYLLSIPRDLWVDAAKAKVNALYALGEANQAGSGPVLVKKVLSEITGLSIDYVLTMNMDTLQKLVDTLGGIEIEVLKSFTDERFPRENVDLSTQDPKLLYETVSFTAGRQHFDGLTTMKYIRSRYSADPVEGTDVARSRRQQAVMMAIFQALKTRNLPVQPQLLGSLYKIWKQNITSDMNDQTLIGLGRQLATKAIMILPISLPVAENSQTGLIRVNPKNRSGQWVFEPVDASWQSFQTFIKQEMHQ